MAQSLGQDVVTLLQGWATVFSCFEWLRLRTRRIGPSGNHYRSSCSPRRLGVIISVRAVLPGTGALQRRQKELVQRQGGWRNEHTLDNRYALMTEHERRQCLIDAAVCAVKKSG